MLERAKRASHIDPLTSSYAIMRRARPYRGENHGPGKDVQGELDPTPGIREQPGSIPDLEASGRSASPRKPDVSAFATDVCKGPEAAFEHYGAGAKMGKMLETFQPVGVLIKI